VNIPLDPFWRVKSKAAGARMQIVCALALITCGLILFPDFSILSAPGVSPAGTLDEIGIDDGDAECTLGPPDPLKGQPGFGWVNKLTPNSYPATLRSITIGFERALVATGVKPDSLFRIVVYLDPEGDGPANGQQPSAAFIGRVRGTDQIMTFNLLTPLAITRGSFAVGAIDEFGIADKPALFDTPGKSSPPGSESFFTLDGGGLWQKLSEGLTPSATCLPGSFLIRATVEVGEVNPIAALKINDPAAVEPWGIGSLGSDVIIANLVSDNLTVVNTTNNSIRSIPIVDPRACATCGPPLGPFGVASSSARNKVYITLFGSNTVPSKEFPVDYSTVMPGRVAVLTKQGNGSYTQSLLGDIGKGPRFPAIAAGKLYVPCGGANRVDVINTANDQKVAEIPVGADPSSCTASLGGSKIYVTNFGDGSVSVIDTRTDKKIKDIPAPSIQFPLRIGASLPIPERPAEGRNPWKGAISPSNGNLYVTYWSSTVGVTGGAVVDVTPNGGIVEFDTCKDEFVRAIIDDTTRGTASGSDGASGIPAPTAPLTRDPATGKTLQAGGGGGGPLGLTACASTAVDLQPPSVVFTNDALGIVGVLDSRVDQLVSAPPIAVTSCPKPRGVACVTVDVSSLGGQPPRPTHFAYVACGQPDSSVLVFRVPELPENLSDIPVIESSDVDEVIRLRGRGFASSGMRLELLKRGACLTFNKKPVLKKNGTLLVQKGGLSDGTRIDDEDNDSAIIRLLHPNGAARVLLRLTAVTAP
jgi:YVTN family beta-propeller protein